MGAHPVADDPAEQLAADAELRAPAHDGPGRLSLERRAVDHALAGDDEVGAARALVEADRVEHELGAVAQLRAERRERRAEAAARARARQVAVRLELVERAEAGFELLDRLGASRPSAGRRRVRRRVRRAAGCARRTATRIGMPSRRPADDLAHPDAAVDRRRATDADEQRGGLLGERREEQLAEPAGRGAQRVALVPPRAAAARPLRPSRRPPCRRAAPASAARPAGRADRRRPPRATRRRAPLDHRGRSLAAVGDRRFVRVDAGDAAHARREQRGGVPRREDALEASRRRESEHAPAPLGRLLGRLVRFLDRPQHRVREAFAREEDEADADADGRLDRLEPDPERDAAGVRDAVVHERDRDRDLHEAEVAGPERERSSRRSSARARARPRTAACRCGTRASPPRRRTAGTPTRRVWNAAAVAAATGERMTASPSRARASSCAPARALRALAVLAPREHQRGNEQQDADHEHDRDRRQRPARDLRREQHPDDERDRREHVEHAVREHRADQRRGRALPPRHAPAQHRDARELADPARAAPRSRTVRPRTPRRRAGSAGTADRATA